MAVYICYNHIITCLYTTNIITHHANMTIDVKDSLVRALFVQFGEHQLLHTKHDSIFTANSNSRAAKQNHTVIDMLRIQVTG